MNRIILRAQFLLLLPLLIPMPHGTQPRSAAMHRAYQPLLPAASRYLQERWDKADYQGHRRKVPRWARWDRVGLGAQSWR